MFIIFFIFLFLTGFFILPKEREPVNIIYKGHSKSGNPLFLAIYPDSRTESIKLLKECKDCFVMVVEDGFSKDDKPMFVAIYPDNSVEKIVLNRPYSTKKYGKIKRLVKKYKNITFFY